MYQPKNHILKAYLENNEAVSAKIGKDEILISVEDVDEIIQRVLDALFDGRSVSLCKHAWEFLHGDERKRAIRVLDLDAGTGVVRCKNCGIYKSSS